MILLGTVVAQSDAAAAWAVALEVGWGMAAVVAIYFLAFAIDSLTWHLALTNVPMTAPWIYRTWKVRMVGEAFNTVLPAAGFGGEPVKAYLFRKHYGIGYVEGYASLILGRTVNMLALIVFLMMGFGLILQSASLPPAFKTVAGAGLVAFTGGVFLFFAVQRFRMSSIAGTALSRRRFARRLEGMLHHVREMDDRLHRFYTAHRARFVVAVLLAFVNWLLGVLEIYVTMRLLGRPVSVADAWIIESVAQLVRAGSFFIPGHIGAQEGAFVLAYAALTGSPTLGLAVALVRRCRELLWLAWGFSLGALYALKPGAAAAAGDMRAADGEQA